MKALLYRLVRQQALSVIVAGAVASLVWSAGLPVNAGMVTEAYLAAWLYQLVAEAFHGRG